MNIDGILKVYDLAIKDLNDGYEVIGKCCSKVRAVDPLIPTTDRPSCLRLTDYAKTTQM